MISSKTRWKKDPLLALCKRCNHRMEDHRFEQDPIGIDNIPPGYSIASVICGICFTHNGGECCDRLATDAEKIACAPSPDLPLTE